MSFVHQMRNKNQTYGENVCVYMITFVDVASPLETENITQKRNLVLILDFSCTLDIDYQARDL